MGVKPEAGVIVGAALRGRLNRSIWREGAATECRPYNYTACNSRSYLVR